MQNKQQPTSQTAPLRQTRRPRVRVGARVRVGIWPLVLTAALGHPAFSQDIAEACERVAMFQFGLTETLSRDVQSFPELDPPRVRTRISGEGGDRDLVAQALARALGQPEPEGPQRVDYGPVSCQFQSAAPPFGLVAFECSGPGCPVSAMRLEELRVLVHREYAGEGEPLAPLPERTGSDVHTELARAIAPCWTVGDLSTEALMVTVTVGFNMTGSGRHEQGSIRLITASVGDERAIAQSFEAARRAIIDCEGDGYQITPDQEGDVRLSFNFESMRIQLED